MTVLMDGGATGMVLARLGANGQPTALLNQASQRLAALTGLSLREMPAVDRPDVALAALAAQRQTWLAPLPVDLGAPLAGGGSWVAALGAWRQPTLLLCSGEQMATGLPAAETALLLQWQVPLLGLLQVGGNWQVRERRLDGLPWLGWLPLEALDHDPVQAGEVDGAVLALALRLRWRQLDLGLPIPI